jgi:hypothetical protein
MRTSIAIFWTCLIAAVSVAYIKIIMPSHWAVDVWALAQFVTLYVIASGQIDQLAGRGKLLRRGIGNARR